MCPAAALILTGSESLQPRSARRLCSLPKVFPEQMLCGFPVAFGGLREGQSSFLGTRPFSSCKPSDEAGEREPRSARKAGAFVLTSCLHFH